MEIRYSYRLEDFEEVIKAAYSDDPRARRIRIGYLLIGIATLLLPFAAAGSVLHPDWYLCGLLPLGACFAYAGLETAKRIARKRYGKSLPAYEYRAVITDGGIVTVSPTVRTELKWQAFSRCIQSANVAALVCEAVMYVFPRRAFTDQQWQEFITMIREHVPGYR